MESSTDMPSWVLPSVGNKSELKLYIYALQKGQIFSLLEASDSNKSRFEKQTNFVSTAALSSSKCCMTQVKNSSASILYKKGDLTNYATIKMFLWS